MALLDSLRSVRDETWERLKDALGKTLVDAAAALKWPLRVDYAAATTAQRRAFERAYTEMLYLQSEGDRLGLHANRSVEPAWASGEGLYPLQALAKPIALRFRYHFQGTRNTNRVDKPEWGFANIIDSVHEHQSFISDYLQPLTARAGYKGIDVTVSSSLPSRTCAHSASPSSQCFSSPFFWASSARAYLIFSPIPRFSPIRSIKLCCSTTRFAKTASTWPGQVSTTRRALWTGMV